MWKKVTTNGSAKYYVTTASLEKLDQLNQKQGYRGKMSFIQNHKKYSNESKGLGMLLKILKDSHPILKRKADAIPLVTEPIKVLAAQMLATMKVNGGIGLAAPQVGRSIRMLVFDTGRQFGILINPEIIETEDLPEAGMEGCLSYPGEFCRVARYKKIKVQYIDLAGKTVVKSFEGLEARVVQHEMDHLDGIVMFDREEQNDNT